MDNITFNLINEMIIDLQGNYDLCHSNGATTHLVNRYTYMVKVVDLQNKRVINLSQDESIAYLEFHGDPRQVKHNFIDSMRAFIRSSARHGENQTTEMNRYHLDDAYRAAEEGRVYHWNGAQLYTKEGSAVKVYDFSFGTITWMTLARSWVYAQENRAHKVDVDSVRYASRSIR